MKEKQKNIRICIMTFPTGKAGSISTLNLVKILNSITNEISLITGNVGYDTFENNKSIHVYGIPHKSGKIFFSRIIRFIITQLRMSYYLIKIMKNIDVLFLTFGSEVLILPVITAKLFQKKIILAMAGSALGVFESFKDFYWAAVRIISKINFILSTKIVIYSKNLIEEFNLKSFQEKIIVAPKHFVNLDKFKIMKTLDDRDNLIGYIGRFNEEKGVFNFVKAIPNIQKNIPNLNFLIIGDGPLKNDIVRFLSDNNLNQKVKVLEWIPHDDMPKYLNELKLLIIPSYTEAGPMILFESMACGTPSIATPVGSVLDLIQDDKTGFIMENNSPECIAKNVERAFNNKNLDKIIINARSLIEREYTYDAAVDRYKIILSEFSRLYK